MPDDGLRLLCHIAWQKDYRIGVTFDDELDGGSFRDAVAGRDPGFDHRVEKYTQILSD